MIKYKLNKIEKIVEINMASFNKKITIKTRNMKKTSLTELIGTGKELLLSELPTYRDTLRYAVLLREQCDKKSRTFLRYGKKGCMCRYYPVAISKR